MPYHSGFAAFQGCQSYQKNKHRGVSAVDWESTSRGEPNSPPPEVSALVFAHPEAEYFNVGQVNKDQVEDYAKRRGDTVADVLWSQKIPKRS